MSSISAGDLETLGESFGPEFVRLITTFALLTISQLLVQGIPNDSFGGSSRGQCLVWCSKIERSVRKNLWSGRRLPPIVSTRNPRAIPAVRWLLKSLQLNPASLPSITWVSSTIAKLTKRSTASFTKLTDALRDISRICSSGGSYQLRHWVHWKRSVYVTENADFSCLWLRSGWCESTTFICNFKFWLNS